MTISKDKNVFKYGKDITLPCQVNINVDDKVSPGGQGYECLYGCLLSISDYIALGFLIE